IAFDPFSLRNPVDGGHMTSELPSDCSLRHLAAFEGFDDLLALFLAHRLRTHDHHLPSQPARDEPRGGGGGGDRGASGMSLCAPCPINSKLYFVNGSAGCSSTMRLRMMLQYSGSRSMPMAEKPSCTAARRVVPEPAKGSRTVPPGGVTRRHR